MTKKFNSYLGKAGHLAVMSEFLMRGWNVAIPEVDIGDDIFVVQDDNSTLRKVQVKTSMAKSTKKGFSAQFSLSLKNLKNISNIPVHYLFIVRDVSTWTKSIIIRQDYLLDHFQNNNVGSKHNDNLTLYFSYSNNNVNCSGQDFTDYICDYTDFQLSSIKPEKKLFSVIKSLIKIHQKQFP
ncbi:MAG TPA: hypothetical protein VIM89_18130 [Mucilaginibacter sp.]